MPLANIKRVVVMPLLTTQERIPFLTCYSHNIAVAKRVVDGEENRD